MTPWEIRGIFTAVLCPGARRYALSPGGSVDMIDFMREPAR